MRNCSKYFLFFTFILLAKLAQAQVDERYNEEDPSAFIPSEGSIQILKLKKSYDLGDGITLRSTSGDLNLTQSLQTSMTVNSSNKNLSNSSSTFNIDRARLSLAANLFDSKFNVYGRLNLPANFQSTTTGSRSFNTVLQEAYFEYRPSINHAFNIGLRADYIDSRETRIEGESLSFINRSSISSTFDAIFDFGIRYKGNYRLGRKQLIRPYLSFTTGDSRSSLQKNYGGFKYGARLDYLPFGKFSKGGEFYMDDLARESKPKLVIGGVYSFNNGTTSAYGVNGGRYLYGDVAQNILLPDFIRVGSDFLFKFKGAYALGSYTQTKVTVPVGIAGFFKTNGTFVKYTQNAQQINDSVLSKLNVGSGINIQAGYLFSSNWSLGFRYTELKADAKAQNFADFNKYYTMVISKYLSGNNLKIQLELGYDQLNKTIIKTPTITDNYYSQLMLTVQL